VRAKFTVFLLFTLLSTDLFAQVARGKWGMTPILGVHHPALDMLNELAFKAPVVGVGTIRGEPNTPQEGDSFPAPFGFENDMPPIGANANIGLEFQWAQSARHVFIMDMGGGYPR